MWIWGIQLTRMISHKFRSIITIKEEYNPNNLVGNICIGNYNMNNWNLHHPIYCYLLLDEWSSYQHNNLLLWIIWKYLQPVFFHLKNCWFEIYVYISASGASFFNDSFAINFILWHVYIFYRVKNDCLSIYNEWSIKSVGWEWRLESIDSGGIIYGMSSSPCLVYVIRKLLNWVKYIYCYRRIIYMILLCKNHGDSFIMMIWEYRFRQFD